MTYWIFVENSGVAGFVCDVLVLKYAQGFHGADGLVASILGFDVADRKILLRPNEHLLLPSGGSLAAKNVIRPNDRFHFGISSAIR